MTAQCLRSTSFTLTPAERHFVNLFRGLDATIRSVVPPEKLAAIVAEGPASQGRAVLREMAVVALEMADEGYESADIAQYLRRNHLPPEWK